MNRRTLLNSSLLSPLAIAIPLSADPLTAPAGAPEKKTGLPDIRITKVRAIATAPMGIPLVVVKVETSEPGLYGLGCATFQQRVHAVVAAVDEYLDDFCRGKSVHDIEDIWQTAYVSSYWRNGPVLNNALSGVDQALWDIKGKLADMPAYQLFGGKCRFAVETYVHAWADRKEDVADMVLQHMENGFRHVRIQLGAYGSTQLSQNPPYKAAGFGDVNDNTINTQAYIRGTVEMFKHVREKCGGQVQLLHDIHERIQPMDAIHLLRELEPYRPYFIEDPVSPENIQWLKLMRQKTSVPIAMGELFNNPHEWLDLITQQEIDFIRIHVSQIGGITPAMKVAKLAEWFNVRTAWHGPGDVSPVGHAAHAHIDMNIWNFGIQEAVHFDDRMRAVFPDAPYMKDGYMHVSEKPGLGVDINETEAAKYPVGPYDYNWTQVRRNDGTPVRP
ncbi:MAG TPA: enolase C-terminal domain-like protein [Pontiella sp.]|nr:enolase C-terminal domain-like protein [Pontiella sp.]